VYDFSYILIVLFFILKRNCT